MSDEVIKKKTNYSVYVVVGRIRCIRVYHLSLAVLKETEGRIPAVTK